MNPKIPDNHEKKKLQEIIDYHHKSEIYMLFMLYPTLLLISLTYFLDNYPILVFTIVMFAIVMLVGIIYLMIKRELIKKCPRCSRRGILPAANKNLNCPGCGMYLDPSYKEEKKEISKNAQKWLDLTR